MQVVAFQFTIKNFYWSAPAALASHVKRSEVSVLYTDEISLVLYNSHRRNLNDRGDIEGNLPKHSEIKIGPRV